MVSVLLCGKGRAVFTEAWDAVLKRVDAQHFSSRGGTQPAFHFEISIWCRNRDGKGEAVYLTNTHSVATFCEVVGSPGAWPQSGGQTLA